MKKTKLMAIIAAVLALSGCNNTNSSNSVDENTTASSDSITTPNTSQNSSDSTNESESETPMDLNSFEDKYNNLMFEDFTSLSDFSLEIGESYSISRDIEGLNGIEVISGNSEYLTYQDGFITGIKEGKIIVRLVLNGSYQDINATIVPQGALSTSFKFDYHRLLGKKLVVFGDSVSAQATIGTGKTYSTLFKETFDMSEVTNYAIGGTTLTYMYPGSSIEKEYGGNATAIDGVRVVTRAAARDELDDADYAIIAYGHNDQYFQPPLDCEDNGQYLDYENCESFKGSFRYIIRMLKRKNPNIRIIVLNCTYSEYDQNMPHNHGSTYTYDDYRTASLEIAEEFSLRYVDPWDYMKDYFDFKGSKQYYSDSVHMTQLGQSVLFNYIIKN